MATCDLPGCDADAQVMCFDCIMVQYCSERCRSQDQERHQMPCLVHKKWREPLMPRIPKGMAPQFVAGSPKSEVGTTETRTATKAFTSTALFNGTYAIDVLRLHEKEGVARTQDINVLFPSHGTDHHMLQTVASIPTTVKSHISIVTNDRKPLSALLSAVILLCLSRLDPERAARVVPELMYSALLTRDVYNTLNTEIVPLLDDLAQWIVHVRSGKPVAPEQSVLTCVAHSGQDRGPKVHLMWTRVMYEDASQVFRHRECTKAQAIESRLKAVSRCEDQIRFHQARLPSEWLPSIRRYHADGILAPFSETRSEYEHPNPFMFSEKGEFLSQPTKTPFDDWGWREIRQHTQLRQNDLIAAVRHTVMDVVRTAAARIQGVDCSFLCLSTDPKQLPRILRVVGGWEETRHDRIGTVLNSPGKHLKNRQQALHAGAVFDRIEFSTSDIIDGAVGGAARWIETFTPLLRPIEHNPQAALVVTLFEFGAFVNSAVQPAWHPESTEWSQLHFLLAHRLLVQGGTKSQFGPETIRRLALQKRIVDHARAYAEFKASVQWDSVLCRSGLAEEDNPPEQRFPLGISLNLDRRDIESGLLRSSCTQYCVRELSRAIQPPVPVNSVDAPAVAQPAESGTVDVLIPMIENQQLDS